MLAQNRKKIIKIIVGILISFVVLILILFAGIQIYVNTHKPYLIKVVNQKLNDAIAGDLSIKDIDVNVWRHFPNVDIRVQNIILKDTLYKKPYLSIRYASTKINAFKLISSEVDIHNVYLEDGFIHLFKDKNNYSNNYIFDNTKKQQPGAHPAIIDEVELKNIQFVTEDAVKK